MKLCINPTLFRQMVEINVIRLFSVRYHRILKVGRVQTLILALLAERDTKSRCSTSRSIICCA